MTNLEELKALAEAGYIFYLGDIYGYDYDMVEFWEVTESYYLCKEILIYHDKKEVWLNCPERI